MNSTEEIKDEPTTILPPMISNNPRKKIEPQLIDLNSLKFPSETPRKRSKTGKELVANLVPEVIPTPCPRSPLVVTWSPDRVFFDLDEEPIIRKLWIWNECSRMLYLHCCGLWNDNGRLGASWRTYPRTRFLLAPGLKTELCIKATPRFNAPVPCAVLCLQLAASHTRDIVTGYFAVPLVAKFLKYKPPCLGEDG